MAGVGGFYASDALSSTYSYGGAVAFYPSEDFGLEVLVTRTPVKFRLEEPFNAFDSRAALPARRGLAGDRVAAVVADPRQVQVHRSDHHPRRHLRDRGRRPDVSRSVLGLTWEAGVGLKLYFSRFVTFRLDVRDFLMPQEVLGRGRTTNNITILAGLQLVAGMSVRAAALAALVLLAAARPARAAEPRARRRRRRRKRPSRRRRRQRRGGDACIDEDVKADLFAKRKQRTSRDRLFQQTNRHELTLRSGYYASDTFDGVVYIVHRRSYGSVPLYTFGIFALRVRVPHDRGLRGRGDGRRHAADLARRPRAGAHVRGAGGQAAPPADVRRRPGVVARARQDAPRRIDHPLRLLSSRPAAASSTRCCPATSRATAASG